MKKEIDDSSPSMSDMDSDDFSLTSDFHSTIFDSSINPGSSSDSSIDISRGGELEELDDLNVIASIEGVDLLNSRWFKEN
jgi:hypothetical protein|mmetsp:Transcript_27183/g.5018  ORF Transcript_27183/g.5018 Transcript_27183/m.5018 type:complete len:80 (+) Transcript_27183:40-279(+)